MKITSDSEARQTVREAYGRIAEEVDATCCESGCGCQSNTIAPSYEHESGYRRVADLGLGCGLPTAFSQIREGDTVVDLGSGAGNDVFIAAEAVGSSGRVIGIDMTESMVLRALKNAVGLGATNVDFRLGEIEDLPVAGNTVDLVISNCVLNLVPNKLRAFSEMFRILRPGGRFTVSDLVVEGVLPPEMAGAASVYAACIGGAIDRQQYLSLLHEAGFRSVEVREDREVIVPKQVIDGPELKAAYERFAPTGGLFSVTITGLKPL